MNPISEQWESLSRDKLVTLRTVQEMIGQDVTTIRRWIKEKKLIAVRVGGQLRCRQSQVLKLIRDLEGNNATTV